MNCKYDYLVVGNSTAAVGAVEAIRKVDKSGTIGIVASETEHTYSRPLITYYMAGKVSEDNIYYRQPDFYSKMNVDCRLGEQVESISASDQAVILDSGEKIGFENLLIAAGGSPIAPPMPGIDRPGVFFMNTIDDARRAKGWLAHAKRAVVIGGGLTGLKTAEALAELGQEVTVVELAPRILSMAMDEIGSEIVRKVFVEHNVDVLTEVQVTSIEGSEDSNDVSSVVLNTGEHIACDSVFVAIGVRPRTDLVKGSGITVNRGILVNSHMQTNISNIYSAGDIAEAYDPLVKSNRVLPILPNAYIGGRVAGLNMVGKNATYNAGMSVNSVCFFGHPFMSAGFSTQEEGDGFKVFSSLSEKNYRRFVIKDSKLVGMLISESVDCAGLLTGIMRADVNVEGMEEAILNGTLGLIDLPENVIEERIHSEGRNWQ